MTDQHRTHTVRQVPRGLRRLHAQPVSPITYSGETDSTAISRAYFSIGYLGQLGSWVDGLVFGCVFGLVFKAEACVGCGFLKLPLWQHPAITRHTVGTSGTYLRYLGQCKIGSCRTVVTLVCR